MAILDKAAIDALKNSIENNLEESKAKDIVTIDLEGKSDVCNYMIIASGTSDRHVVSIAEKLIYHLKHEEDDIPYNSEGLDQGQWVLVDTAGIVIHLFHPEVREYYDLETLWSNPKTRKIEK